MQGGDGYSSEQWDLIKSKISRVLAIYPPYPGAEVIYIDQVAGSDTTGDGSEELPYQTLTYAESVAAARATLLAWGTFHENVIIDVTGLRLFGLGKTLTVIDGIANATPKLTLDADRLEVGLIGFGSGGLTGHGIFIDDCDYSRIHHNIMDTITGAFHGIAKTAVPTSVSMDIDHNIIRDGVNAGIHLEEMQKSTIRNNICVGNSAEGIRLLANSTVCEVIGNICNDNDEGIEIQGNNNNMIDNIALGNTTANIIDTGAGNNWKSPQRIPRWDPIATVGADIPVGLGVPLTLVTVNPAYPCNVALDLNCVRYVGGDDVIIDVEKRIDLVNWVSVGYIVITGGNIVTVLGTPYFAGAAIRALDYGGFCFQFYCDAAEQFRVIVNQTAGVLRQVDYLYNLKREIS